jgi:hypothetical protein
LIGADPHQLVLDQRLAVAPAALLGGERQIDAALLQQLQQFGVVVHLSDTRTRGQALSKRRRIGGR